MGSPSPASSSKTKEASSKTPKAPLLDSRRLFELIGLLTGVAGLLILLSLASYLPEDPSLNTAVATGTLPHNWIGPAGAFVADGLFQVFGWVAYLLPLALLVVGVRGLLARPFEAPRTKMLGAGMLVLSLGALLELFPYTPAIHGVLRGGGLLGYLAAAGLIHTFNRLGASIVAATLFLTSLFLVTRFSFGWAAEFLQNRWSRVLTPLKTRWSAWQEARAAKAAARLRKQMERATRDGQTAGAAAKGGRPASAAGTTHHHAARQRSCGRSPGKTGNRGEAGSSARGADAQALALQRSPQDRGARRARIQTAQRHVVAASRGRGRNR